MLINLNNNSQINCYFSNGFKKTLNNKTFTVNDKDGIIIIILLIIFIIMLYLKKYKLGGILFIILAYLIYYEPLRIIYPFSYLLSCNLNTSHYLDKNTYFPNYRTFENKETYRLIQREVNNYILNNNNTFIDTKDSFGKKTNSYIGGGNTVVGKKWRISTVMIGTKIVTLAEKTMPILVNILKKNRNIISCVISFLPAKKAIPIHTGYFKGLMRYQLAIKVPKDRDNVFICVNGEKYSWKEGEGVLFDDIYAHKVYNNTDEDRIVLYMDIKRKFNNKILDILNNSLIKLATSTSIAQNEIKKTEKLVNL